MVLNYTCILAAEVRITIFKITNLQLPLYLSMVLNYTCILRPKGYTGIPKIPESHWNCGNLEDRNLLK